MVMNTVMNDYRIISRPRRDLLGEGPLWSRRRNALYWVDINGQRLHCLSLADETVRSWSLPEKIGWVIERAQDEQLVAGLMSGFALLRLDPLEISKIGSPEPERPGNRLNDAKADQQGRIWAGSKHDGDASDAAPSGALYRLDPGFTWQRHDDHYGVANGPTFSPDGRILYHTDSAAGCVYAFDLSADGELRNKRLWLQFPKEWGSPDGMTTDAEGCVWIAHWDGGCVSRFDPDGRRLRSIKLPATHITSCAFAGDQLDRLFVTSSCIDHEHEPEAGALFEVNPGVRGLPPGVFAG